MIVTQMREDIQKQIDKLLNYLKKEKITSLRYNTLNQIAILTEILNKLDRFVELEMSYAEEYVNQLRIGNIKLNKRNKWY